MSAQSDTKTVDAIQEVLMDRAGWQSLPARRLAEAILEALPDRCDFEMDCDWCRADEESK